MPSRKYKAIWDFIGQYLEDVEAFEEYLELEIETDIWEFEDIFDDYKNEGYSDEEAAQMVVKEFTPEFEDFFIGAFSNSIDVDSAVNFMMEESPVTKKALQEYLHKRFPEIVLEKIEQEKGGKK